MADTLGNNYSITVAEDAIPFIGNAWQFKKDPLAYVESLREAGDIVLLRIGKKTVYFIAHPYLIDAVLRDGGTFDKGGPIFDTLSEILREGITTSPNRKHQRQRRLLQPLFSKDRIASYASVMESRITELSATWLDGEVIDISQEMTKLAMQVTTTTLFSSQADSRAIEEVQEALPVIFDGVFRRATSPLPILAKIPTRKNKNFSRKVDLLHTRVDEIISNNSAGANGDGEDILTLLVGSQGDAEQFTLSEIHDHVISFLLAGIETTASALSWVFSTLAQEPDIQLKAREEVRRIAGSSEIRASDVPNLTYIRWVLLEALRLYPPTWLLSRYVTQDVNLGGCEVPSGSTILYSPYAIHRDSRFYPEAKQFMPERWGNGAMTPERRAFLPFGGGRRKCMGDNFALLESVLVISRMVQIFDFSLAAPVTLPKSPRISLAPISVPIRLRKIA